MLRFALGALVILAALPLHASSITSTSPGANEKAAARTANLSASCDQAIDAATVTQSTFLVQGAQSGRIAGTFSTSGSTFTLDPAADLQPGEMIRVTATGGIEDTTSVPLTPRVWGFTAAAADATGVMLRHAALGSGNSQDVVLGDLDGDGDLDAVLGNGGTEPETVWVNDGGGNFSAHPAQPSFGAGNTSAVELGDLDGDGDLDVALGNAAGEAETVWLNDGSGNFTTHPVTPGFGAGDTRGLALGDLDADGDLDAVAANHSADGNTVWLNDGDGTFSANGSFGGPDSLGVSLGDLDTDGDLDAILARDGAETVWLNDGTGAFAAHSATPTFGAALSRAAGLGDLDGDGDLDAVVAGGHADTVWVNDGDGNFTEHPATPELDEDADGTAVEVSDVDGDGDLDALIANDGAAVSVWLNDGDGNLSPHPSAAFFGAGSHTVASGDVDGDGDLDVATASCCAEGAAVFLNSEIAISAVSGATTEAGGTATFTVVLEREPAANVTIQLTSSDTTEARLSAGGAQQDSVTLTFTSADWNDPQTVTIHGQNDSVDDGDVASTIVTAPAVSADPFFSGADPADVTNTNTDDDTAGVTITPESFSIGEGEIKFVSVVLDTQPAGNVVIDFATTNIEEVVVAAHVTFTTANWSTPQAVRIRGSDDRIDDGDRNTAITVAIDVAATADPLYDTIDPADLTVTAIDDDTVGVTVTPLALSVDEVGTTRTFSVHLHTRPVGNVVIDLTSLDTGEATVSPAQLTFPDASWMQSQTATVQGVNDGIEDGDQVSTIAVTVNAAATADPVYHAIEPADVIVTTIERETTTTTLTSSLNPSLSGQTVTFTATVTSATPGAITGTVTFRAGTFILGEGPRLLIDGQASLSISTLSGPFTRSITAQYAGDANFLGSTSAVLSQTVNVSPFGPPPFLTATAATATGVFDIFLQWGQVSGATSYELFVSSNGAPFSLVSPVSTSVFTGVPDTTYLFKVRAIGSSGPSAFSGVEAATTIHWFDKSLVGKGVRVIHVNDLRRAANMIRAAAGLAPAVFTDPVLTEGSTVIKRIHLVEVRAAIDTARAVIGLPPIPYTDPVITANETRVKRVHVEELREAVR
jgi:Bacterial Ig-like domain (group 3)/Bacterial Ig-like domain/FG-GAP-like repeat